MRVRRAGGLLNVWLASMAVANCNLNALLLYSSAGIALLGVCRPLASCSTG